jgi:hypothetical protein
VADVGEGGELRGVLGQQDQMHDVARLSFSPRLLTLGERGFQARLGSGEEVGVDLDLGAGVEGEAGVEGGEAGVEGGA